MLPYCVWAEECIVLQQKFFAIRDLHVSLDEVLLRRFIQLPVFLIFYFFVICLLLLLLIGPLILAQLLAMEFAEDVVVLLRADVFLLSFQQILDELI